MPIKLYSNSENFSNSYSEKWGLWDSIQLRWIDQSIDNIWSKPFVVYRVSKNSPTIDTLNNRNFGNFHGQLHYLQNIRSHIGPENLSKYSLKAYLIQVNPSRTSDYFHCELGVCEFRLTCLNGPCKTKLSHIKADYNRVGIKPGTGNTQVSRCKRPYVCAQDIGLDSILGEERINACADHSLDCFFAFPEGGLESSFRILHAWEPHTLTTNEDFTVLLQNIEKSLLGKENREAKRNPP